MTLSGSGLFARTIAHLNSLYYTIIQTEQSMVQHIPESHTSQRKRECVITQFLEAALSISTVSFLSSDGR